MANVKNNAAAKETRRRLLEAAGEIFAERGYHAATIKHITDRAGASLASVNYHFRDKAALYAAVLQRIARDAAVIVPPNQDGRLNPRARLKRAIRHLVLTVLARERPHWERILLAREFAHPTAAVEPLIREIGRPLLNRLSTLVAQITGDDVRSLAVTLTTSSILAQCLYYVEYQALIPRLDPQLAARLEPELIAEHVAEFSLAAIPSRPRPRPGPRLRRSHPVLRQARPSA